MQRINKLRMRRMSRFKSRAELDSSYVCNSEVYEESDLSDQGEDQEQAFKDIDRVKEVLSIRTDIVSPTQNATTEESMARTASFKPPSCSSSRTSVKRSQVSPMIQMLPRLGACESKETVSSRRSSGGIPSTEPSEYPDVTAAKASL
jgi:hypothetical protein